MSAVVDLGLPRTRVDDALPEGERYKLPDDLAKEFASVERKESPSSIRTYMGCPMRWYLDRYSGAEGDPSGFPAVVGTFVHRVLEVFYAEPPEMRTAELLDRVFKTLWAAMQQRAITGIVDAKLQHDFDTLEEMDSNPDGMRGRFYKRARNCVEAALGFDDDDPASVEVIANETWIRMKVNGTWIRGKIDRIRKTPGRQGETVQDWKTGRPPAEDEEFDILSDSFLAMGVYALARSQGTDPSGKEARLVNRVELLFLGNQIRYRKRVTAEMLDEVTELLYKVTDGMNEAAETGYLVAQPGDTVGEGACTWCGAAGICPAWQEDGSWEPLREQWEI